LEEEERLVSISRPVMLATFGPDVRIHGATDLCIGNGPLEVVGLNPPNEYGCKPINQEPFVHKNERPEDVNGKVILVKRGECTFADKVQNAVFAGAKAVIVANEDEHLLIPTSDRIQPRDENETILGPQTPSSSSADQESSESNPMATGLSDADQDHFNQKLKSIPLLFSTLETGRLIGNLLAHRPLRPGSPPHPLIRPTKLLIEIVDNPLDLLDHPHTASATSYPLPNLNQPPKFVFINGYKLSNLVLKT
jgi:hypothetical protein